MLQTKKCLYVLSVLVIFSNDRGNYNIDIVHSTPMRSYAF
jgi:hypothetical protein